MFDENVFIVILKFAIPAPTAYLDEFNTSGVLESELNKTTKPFSTIDNLESLILILPYKVAERLFSFGLLSEFKVGKRLPFITVPIGTTCECAYIENNKNKNVSLYIIKSFVSMIHNNQRHHKLK